MENSRNDEIIYEKGWQKISTAEVITPVVDDKKQDEETSEIIEKTEKKKKKQKKPFSFPALISIQLVLCIIIAVVVLSLKLMGSQAFSLISDWYYDMSDIKLVPNEAFEKIDLSEYFSSTLDQAATNDEV